MQRSGPDQPAANLSRRTVLGMGAGALGAAIAGPTLLSACGSSSSGSKSSSTTIANSGTQQADDMASLMRAAKSEGTVTTCAVGTPHSYYVPVLDAFESYSGIKVNAKNPTYPPKLELSDLATAAKSKSKAPYDVVEMGVDTSATAASEGLLEAYLSSTWEDIPSIFKDPNGAWSASYFGLVSFLTNTGATKGFAPTSWDELAHSSKTPKRSFAMLGDPRSSKPLSGGIGLLTILSASLANGGTVDDVEPGIDLLASLVDKGIFDPTESSALTAIPDTVATSSAPINALFSFDAPLAIYDGRLNFTKVIAHSPTDGKIAGFYPQAVAKNASHPSAAKLWIEFLQSDTGAEAFLHNGAYPTRYAALANNGPTAVKKLIADAAISDAAIPTQQQLAAAQKTIDAKWASKIPTT